MRSATQILPAVAAGWSHYLTVILEGIGIHLPDAITHAPGTAPGAIINLPALLVVLAWIPWESIPLPAPIKTPAASK